MTAIPLILAILVTAGCLIALMQMNSVQKRHARGEVPPLDHDPEEDVLRRLAEAEFEATREPVEPRSPASFGYKTSWLAIRGEDAHAVVSALGLRDAASSSWSEGLARAYDGDVFVTPPVDGWILAVGAALGDALDWERLGPGDDWTTQLSSRLGTEVQLFSTHRGVEWHAWMRANSGVLERAYAYAADDGVVADVGDITEAEDELGCELTGWSDEDEYGETEPPDESHVMEVAGRWSVDPTEIEDHYPELGPGWAGALPRSRGPER